MARIPLVDPASAAPEVRAQYQELEALGFPVMNVFKVFGNHAGILPAFRHLVKALYAENKLAPRHRELAYLRASQVNACHY